MHREYHRWFSHHLQRDMELLIFGHGGRAILFFPTRMARFYDYENWKIIEALESRINNGELQLFCVDSVDSESFYNRHVHPSTRIHRHLQYEQYISKEVIPFMHSRNGVQNVDVAGCSMGAYHAVNLALKFPFLFNRVVGMSGRYDLTLELHHFSDLFDGYHDENIYFNMPLQYLSNLRDEYILKYLKKLDIKLVIGETDPFLSSNWQLRDLLGDKGISNQLYIWDNDAHRPRYWRKMVQLYL